MSIESNLYRILDGKISYGEGLFIRDPSFKIKKLGRLVYQECMDFLDDGVLDDKQLRITLVEYALWSNEKEKRLKDLPKIIENAKVGYFQNYSNPSVRKTYKNLLNFSYNEFSSLSKIRYKYQYLTPEGIASSAMWIEMIRHMYSGNNLMGALGYYYTYNIDENDIRDVALSNEWAVYSSLNKSPFARSPFRMTDYQRKLMSWTNIYRNVRTHPDFPGYTLIEDHDAFDGWMIILNRKEAAEKSKKTNITNLKSNSRNVFMGQATAQETDEIMSLNSPEMVIKIGKEHEANKH